MKIRKIYIDTYCCLIYNPYSNFVNRGNDVSFYFSGPKSNPQLHVAVSCYVSLVFNVECF